MSSPHRLDAFAAAQFGIDELKATAPIWKRESWAGGESWGLDAQQLRDVVGGSVAVAEEHGATEAPAVFGDVLDMFVRSASGWIDSRRGDA